MLDSLPYRVVVAVDFEFTAPPGERPTPIAWWPWNCAAVSGGDSGTESSDLYRPIQAGLTCWSLLIMRAPSLVAIASWGGLNLLTFSTSSGNFGIAPTG